MKNARNVAIILLLAAAIVALPGAGDTAGLIGAIFSLAIVALLAYLAGRFYRDHQIDLYGLGDLDRGILYAAFAVVVLVIAGFSRLTRTPGGTLAAIALLVLCVGGVLRVYHNWQRY